MKNLKLLPVNEIGVYEDSDGQFYEAKIIGILIKEDEKDFFMIRPISELDVQDGFIDLKDYDGFQNFKKYDRTT